MSSAHVHLLLLNWSAFESKWQAVHETIFNFRWFLIRQYHIVVKRLGLSIWQTWV